VRFAQSMANIGSKLQSTVKAYNDAIPGLDRFIVAKSRTLKQLGSGKGAEAELPEAIELEPRPFSSRELRASNLFLQEENDLGLDMAASASQVSDGE
jgi:DNA anti-recombination protein RmuC